MIIEMLENLATQTSYWVASPLTNVTSSGKTLPHGGTPSVILDRLFSHIYDSFDG